MGQVSPDLIGKTLFLLLFLKLALVLVISSMSSNKKVCTSTDLGYSEIRLV